MLSSRECSPGWRGWAVFWVTSSTFAALHQARVVHPHAHDGHQLLSIICKAHDARHSMSIVRIFEGRVGLFGWYADILKRQWRSHRDAGTTVAASPRASSAIVFVEVLTLLKLHAKGVLVLSGFSAL